jgi:uncharacterized cupredoxin-like copper-binding protein
MKDQLARFLLASVVAATFVACGSREGGAELQARVIRVTPTDQLTFEPAVITMRVGERISLTIDNRNSASLHDFTVDAIPVRDVHADGDQHVGAHIDQAALHVAVEGGKTGTMAFAVTAPGEYEFYCTVPNHAAAGMKGRIVVEG